MSTDQLILAQFIKNHPRQVVLGLKAFSYPEIASFLEAEPLESCVDIVNAMSSYRAAKCIECLSVSLALQLLERINLGLKMGIFRQFNEHFRDQLLSKMTVKEALSLRQNLSFTLGTAGYLMRPLVLSFSGLLSVEESIIIVRSEHGSISHSLTVVDEAGKPEGVIMLQDLLLADRKTPLSALMKTEFPRFYAEEPIESIKDHLGWYEYPSIPVIDDNDILIGTLDYRDVIESRLNKDNTNEGMIATGTALGELYRIGLTGFLQSVSK